MSKLSFAEIEDLKRRNPCHQVAGQRVSLRRKGDGFVGPCPLHSPDPAARDSTAFECDADGWVCATCSDGGDVIRLVALMSGLDPEKDFRKALALLPDGGTRSLSAEEQAALDKRAEERATKAAQDTNEWREKARRRAWDLWAYARPFPGTPGEAYLRLRLGGMDPPRLRLRFDPAARYYVEDRPQWRLVHTGPAIVAAIQRSGQFIGCHRTFIDLDRPKGKAIIVDPKTGETLNSKTMHGGKRGGHIDLAGAREPRVLVLGEGTEKVAAVLAAFAAAGRDVSDHAFWSAGDLGNLGGKAAGTVPHPEAKTPTGRASRVGGPEPDMAAPGIEIPDTVERLVLLGDVTSDPFATQCTMARAAARFLAQRQAEPSAIAVRDGSAKEKRALEVVCAWGPDGRDFDDVLREAA